jgi:regulator of protease activity HflC (stomatin/prohibitin superfamily)
MFSELPRFNKASRYRVPLLVGGAVLACVGAALIGAVWAHTTFGWFSGLPGPAALSYLGAALSVAAAGLLCAAMLTIVRHRSLTVKSRPDSRPVRRRRVPASPQVSETGWDLPGRLLALLWSLVPPRPSMADWPHVLVATLMGMVAIIGVWVGWRISVSPTVNAIALQVLAGSFVVVAFVLLVLERMFANIDAEELPEAPQIDRLLRVPLTGCLALGIASVIQSLGFAWAQRIEQVFAAVVAVVALELVLRGAAFIFIPFAPLEERRSVADSSIAGLLRPAVPNFHAFNTAVQRQFGIDLSRSWALAFVQRAAVPIALGMAVMAWGITGMTALGINQRAVYERFGVPVQVLGPGLHVHLPWPMGIMRQVEFGVIHDIPIAFAPATGNTSALRTSAGVDQQQQQAVGAEALPPVSADRLWDASHPSEQSYLIASETRGEQSFQVVDADLRIVYRIGLSDAAALDSAYRVEGPENLIRAAAGQLLVRYFSRYTLADVLGQSREAFTNEFRGALQNELDRLSSGIEAIAVVVEAIHPPPGAASAYQYVQASEILSKSTISIRRAEAIRALKSAAQYALEDRSRAEAGASELVNQARGESVLFEADRKANQRDSGSFLLERRFERLVGGLSRSEFIVIDHRAAAKNGPFIDLRSFEGGGGQFGRRDFGFPPGPPGAPGRNPVSDDDDDRYR